MPTWGKSWAFSAFKLHQHNLITSDVGPQLFNSFQVVICSSQSWVWLFWNEITYVTWHNGPDMHVELCDRNFSSLLPLVRLKSGSISLLYIGVFLTVFQAEILLFFFYFPRFYIWFLKVWFWSPRKAYPTSYSWSLRATYGLAVPVLITSSRLISIIGSVMCWLPPGRTEKITVLKPESLLPYRVYTAPISTSL